MDISRRFFLRGALAVSAVSVLPSFDVLSAQIPTIVGDGIHDDADGLNALFAGKPFRCDLSGIKVQDGFAQLNNGVFFISKTVEIPELCERFAIDRCVFRARSSSHRGSAALKFHNSTPGLISNCHFMDLDFRIDGPRASLAPNHRPEKPFAMLRVEGVRPIA
jgi:hypothetical protein